jgi:hypothetical protein
VEIINGITGQHYFETSSIIVEKDQMAMKEPVMAKNF